MKQLLIIIFTVWLMTSCGVYTSYSRPEMDIEGLNEPLVGDTTSLASLSWKELFTDKRLQALVTKGLEQNTDLRIAHLRVKETEAVLMNARLSYLPALSMNAEGVLNSLNGAKPVKTYNLGATASWEIDVFGKITNGKKGAQAALEASKTYRQAVQSQLVATIANSYYTLLALDVKLAINESTLSNWESTVKTLEALKRAGEANDAGILQAKANRMLLEASVLSIKQSINEMENSISVLLAMTPQSIDRGTLAQQDFPEAVSAGVSLQFLANRPDVRQAEFELAQSFYATNAARSAFYPSITLSGAAGWTNNAGVIVNPGQWLLNAIGTLAQPLFNRGANIANLKIAKAKQEEATFLFQQSILEAGREVNDALMHWQTSQRRIVIGEQRVATLQKAVHKTELLMKHSSINYLEVLTAQQSLLDAEQTVLQDRLEKIQGIINLYHALGGGK